MVIPLAARLYRRICTQNAPSFALRNAVQGVELSEFTDDKALHPQGVDTSEPAWERLDWVADEHIQKECKAARGRALKIVEDSDDSVLWFDAYGAEWIKNEGLLSPLSHPNVS